MTRWMRDVLAMAFVLVLVASGRALAEPGRVNRAIDDLLGSHAPYEAVITALQQGVREQDAAAVAALVRYPITVRIEGRRQVVRGPRAFAAHYGSIVTPAIAKVVERQTYDDLMVSSRGVMFGDGEVWINGVCRDAGCKDVDVKVVTIQP